jgi:thiamine kinase-like enzyme
VLSSFLWQGPGIRCAEKLLWSSVRRALVSDYTSRGTVAWTKKMIDSILTSVIFLQFNQEALIFSEHLFRRNRQTDQTNHSQPRKKKEEIYMSDSTSLLEKEFTKDICCELLPEWKDLDITISQLSGGITNKLYRIQSEAGDYTVRIYGDQTELFIDRQFEADTIKAMAKIGVGSKLIKFMPEIGVTIVEFIGDSIVLNNDHFLDQSLYPQIVDPIRKIHGSGIQLPKIFNPLVEVKKMFTILNNLKVEYPEFDIAGTIERFEKLTAIINIPEAEYTACHNDLLADNFILINEEARHKYDSSMYIIDWEYAGMAPRYYDIADMFQEILVPREAEKGIVAEYSKGDNFDRNLYFIDLFKPFPDIYWFLWSLIQLNISKIEFDYYTYGKIKYENAIENLKFIKKEHGVAV